MKKYFILLILLFVNVFRLHAQAITNYEIADSLFINFTKNIEFCPDSLPLLSLSPQDFKLYIENLTKKQLIILDSFQTQVSLDMFTKNQLIAKITYQNVTYILAHPIENGFFEVQQDENYSEEVKSFYRESYKDYSLFLDTLEISNNNYLPVKEYLNFLNVYLDYQEIRFHLFNNQINCTEIDRYWLIKLLFAGKVRGFMAKKELIALKNIFSEQDLSTVIKDFRQKYDKMKEK
jgi:hypothetical protein